MAESASQRKLRKLREQRRAAMSRSEGGSREDEAVDKTVNPPTPTTTVTKAQHEFHTGTTTSASYQRKQEAEEATQNQPSRRVMPRQNTKGQARTYQKHVLFAIVSAFLIKMVSSGKLSPKS